MPHMEAPVKFRSNKGGSIVHHTISASPFNILIVIFMSAIPLTRIVLRDNRVNHRVGRHLPTLFKADYP